MTNTSKLQFITVLRHGGQPPPFKCTRHAPARFAIMRSHKIRDAVRLEGHDNGRVFQANRILSFNTSARLGLLGMMERIEKVGGVFAHEPACGKGNAVQAEILFCSNRQEKRV